MYTVSSQTVSEDFIAEEVPLLEWKFQIDNGNIGEMIVSDVLLNSELLATERAKSEFLKNSYKANEVTFTTHLTDFVKNQTINVYGIPYIIKSLNTVIDEVSIKTKVRGIRYD